MVKAFQLPEMENTGCEIDEDVDYDRPDDGLTHEDYDEENDKENDSVDSGEESEAGDEKVETEMSNIRCFCHTVQLCVKDGLKSCPAPTLSALKRGLMQLLVTSLFHHRHRASGDKLPQETASS